MIWVTHDIDPKEAIASWRLQLTLVTLYPKVESASDL